MLNLSSNFLSLILFITILINNIKSSTAFYYYYYRGNNNYNIVYYSIFIPFGLVLFIACICSCLKKRREINTYVLRLRRRMPFAVIQSTSQDIQPNADIEIMPPNVQYAMPENAKLIQVS